VASIAPVKTLDDAFRVMDAHPNANATSIFTSNGRTAREFSHRVVDADFVPAAREIKAAYDAGDVLPVELHDGSRVLLRKIAKDFEVGNRGEAISYVRAHQRAGEIVTGLLYVDEGEPDLHEVNGTTETPLNAVPYETLCPGTDALAALQDRFR
jgi:2-oxoglutarate ferredoxin oxidoreductase subunit beta